MKERITSETSEKIIELATKMSSAAGSRWLWNGIDTDRVNTAKQKEDEAWKELKKLLINLEIGEV